jgi:hypothetical protein
MNQRLKDALVPAEAAMAAIWYRCYNAQVPCGMLPVAATPLKLSCPMLHRQPRADTRILFRYLAMSYQQRREEQSFWQDCQSLPRI